jgi:hypothetical protein
MNEIVADRAPTLSETSGRYLLALMNQMDEKNLTLKFLAPSNDPRGVTTEPTNAANDQTGRTV